MGVSCRAGLAGASTVLLTLAIALSWVGVAQMARLAELAPGCEASAHQGGGVLANATNTHDDSRASAVDGLGSHSCTYLIVWLNGTSWIFLGLPWVVQRMMSAGARSNRPLPQADPHDSKKPEPNHLVEMWNDDESSDDDYFDIDAGGVPYRWRHVIMFFALALSTNYSYIAALEFIPASLNTAVFAISPLLTLALSVAFLAEDIASPRARWVSVGMSIGGVVLIAQPWRSAWTSTSSTAWSRDATKHLADARLAGSVLSLMAAVGTATYQVAFKKILGKQVSSPTQLGLFMAKLGSQIFIVYGAALLGSILAGVYRLDFYALPYSLLVGTAMASLIFNFIIKFGLSISSPVVVSLATQLGIPLNLMIDVVWDPSGSANALDSLAVVGVGLMLVSFALNTIVDISVNRQRAAGQQCSGRSRRLCGSVAGGDETGKIGSPFKMHLGPVDASVEGDCSKDSPAVLP